MTRVATRRDPAADPFGTGFLPRLLRTVLHALLVHQAITREWPLTRPEARAEVQIALTDIQALESYESNDLLSEEARQALTDWRHALEALVGALDGQDPLGDDQKRAIQENFVNAMAILAVLDADLLGIERSNGGTTP